MRWSVHALVVLFTVIWPGMVNGTYLGPFLGKGVDGDRSPLVDQVVVLIEKINKQEDRLQTVETQLAKHTIALVEKDRRIDHLERELEYSKSRAEPIHTSQTTRNADGILEENHPDRSATIQTGHDRHIFNQYRHSIATHNLTQIDKPSQKQSISIADHRRENGNIFLPLGKAGLDVIFERRHTNLKSFENARSTEKRQSLTVNQHNKRVDNTSPIGYAFSLSLSANTNVVLQSIIKYDDVMLDEGNGYNHGNGIYEIPTSGVYVFTWTIMSGTNNGGSMSTHLMVNGVVRSATDADSDAHNWEAATGLIVTSVSKGDHVYILAYSTGQVISDTNNRSTFSGWRLF
ncbi:uncharacterized protein LOC110454072 [Mizuhopecten yessoensis]|uniref:Complement C1q-like protein 4 n=1 Tax=Mizuhopecten yessoensis TaxID=6573 RepID=A0A210QFY7_MIZYE|nr:uncharacterized protein LOC110454072 [Mizuhopecten yessoensis]OWF47660.1 Complement C1q-like protein 4 [Mizuhopecten yessoensis]